MPNITKILFRRGLNSQRQNVQLQLGEPGYSIDTKRLFVGDGISLGGTPAGIINYGIVPVLSGNYVYSVNSTQTNLTSASFITLSAANIGDVVYDATTTSLYSVSSITTIGTLPNITNFVTLSNFAHLFNATGINTSQFYYNGPQLTILNSGVGINQIDANITAASPTLSGGSGNVLDIKSKSISNNYLTPAIQSNSVKITDNTGTVTDILINQNQLLGQTNAAGSSLRAVNIIGSGSTTLSANINTISINSPSVVNYLPLSGGSIIGSISALNINGGRLVTDITPVNPDDVVNLDYLNGFSCTQPSYLFSHFLALTGGTLSGPGTLNVIGRATFGSTVTAAGSFTTSGSISALGNLSATRITQYSQPVFGTDVTNKLYVDSKFVPLSGGTLTGNLTASALPKNSTELAMKGYVDTVANNYFPLSGGTVTGAVSSTNRIYVTSTPVVSAELTNKNYVDTQVVNATPIGCVAYFASTTAPTGWIKANGAVLPIASYQSLFNNLAKQGNGNTVWWIAGDGPTNFRLPDLRGQFVRGWNDGVSNGNTTNLGTNPAIATTDASRGFGTLQADAFQGHYHTTNAVKGAGPGGAVGNPGGNFGDATVTTPITDGTNGTPRTGSETRPTNVNLLACIKY